MGHVRRGGQDPGGAGAVGDEILDRCAQVHGRPAQPARDRARRVAAHHDDVRAVRFEPRQVCGEQAVQIGVAPLAVWHVRLVGEIHDVVADARDA